MILTNCYRYCFLLFLLASFAVEAKEVKLDHAGKTLNADLVVANGGRIADDITVILHGTLGHKDMEIIESMQSVLEESGRSSLAINLSLNVDDRHGFFDCSAPHTHRADDAVDELSVWMTWLMNSSAKRISLIGHSRGANQALKYVLSGASPVSNLVLLAPPAGSSLLPADELQNLGSMAGDEWLLDAAFLHCDGAQVQVASYLSYRGENAETDTVALLADVEVPTLVISGSDDAVSKGLGSRMADVVNESVSHQEIEGAGHFFRDLYMYDVVDAVDAFLGEDQK